MFRASIVATVTVAVLAISAFSNTASAGNRERVIAGAILGAAGAILGVDSSPRFGGPRDFGGQGGFHKKTFGSTGFRKGNGGDQNGQIGKAWCFPSSMC